METPLSENPLTHLAPTPDELEEEDDDAHLKSQHRPWRIAHWLAGQFGTEQRILHICMGLLAQTEVLRLGKRVGPPKPESTTRRGGPSLSLPLLYSPPEDGALHLKLQQLPSRIAHWPDGQLGARHRMRHIWRLEAGHIWVCWDDDEEPDDLQPKVEEAR